MKPKRRLLLVAAAVALIVFGLVVLLSRRHVQLYKVTVLPSPSGTVTRPVAINDIAQVVGVDYTPGGPSNLFLWDRENGMRNLGPGFSIDINKAGQVAGTMIDPNGNMKAFLLDPKEGRKMLGTIGGAESSALAINNRGQIVGFLGSVRRRTDAVIWDKTGSVRKLLPDDQRGSNANAINDAGQVMGFTGDQLSFSSQSPCFWVSSDPAGTPMPPLETPIDYPGGSDLNNNGYVVGRAYNWDKDGMWTFLWTKETGLEGMKYLFPLEQSVGHLRINDANQVLYGQKHTSSLERISRKYFEPYTQHCLWDPKRGKIVLDRQIPREIGKLLHVEDINNKGCIVATVRSGALGHQVAVLLEPIPERWGK